MKNVKIILWNFNQIVANVESKLWETHHTLTWKTLKPFIHATNLDNVVLPAPLTPINNKWPYEEEIRMCHRIVLVRPALDSYMRTTTPSSEHILPSSQFHSMSLLNKLQHLLKTPHSDL